jgi:sec-independent protein translocase protein TatC
MRHGSKLNNPEDLFADTRMPFGDHLEQLRWHLWRAVIGFGVVVVLVFVLDFVGYVTDTPVGVAKPVMDLITLPVERELQTFYDRRAERLARQIEAGQHPLQGTEEAREVGLDLDLHELARQLAPLLGLQPPDAANPEGNYVPVPSRVRPLSWTLALQEAQRLLGRRPTLRTLSITEPVFVYFKVALVCGVVLGSPWIFWQAWAFVAVGLYPHEKRSVHVYLPFSLGLFLTGVFVCQFWVMPRAVAAMLWFNEWLDWEPDLRISEWLGFAIWMPLVFGVSFQTPLVMRFLERLGIMTVATFQQKRRLAWFLLAGFAALITPSSDVQSLLLLWLPLAVLYELGILLCRLSPRRPSGLDRDALDTAETVEV